MQSSDPGGGRLLNRLPCKTDKLPSMDLFYCIGSDIYLTEKDIHDQTGGETKVGGSPDGYSKTNDSSFT